MGQRDETENSAYFQNAFKHQYRFQDDLRVILESLLDQCLMCLVKGTDSSGFVKVSVLFRRECQNKGSGRPKFHQNGRKTVSENNMKNYLF